MRPPAGTDAPAEDYAFEAESRLRDFVRSALGSDDGVECLVAHGSEVNALLSAAQGAQLLVVGEPRPGRLASMFSSLTAPQVVLRAQCPVVVMPSAVTAAAA